MPLVRAYIALGSNLGDRLGQMQSALKALAADNPVSYTHLRAHET